MSSARIQGKRAHNHRHDQSEGTRVSDSATLVVVGNPAPLPKSGTDGAKLTDSATVVTTGPKISFLVQPSGTGQAGVALAQSPTIQLLDASDNPLARSGVQLTISHTGPAGSNASYSVVGGGLAITDAQGRVALTNVIFSGLVGTYRLVVSATGFIQSVSSDVLVSAGPTQALSTTASVPQSWFVNSPVVIDIQARDQFGNARTTGGDAVTVAVTGVYSNSGAATDNANGTYRRTHTPTVAGAVSAAITINGTAIGQSPFARTVAAQPVGSYPNKPGTHQLVFVTPCDSVPPDFPRQAIPGGTGTWGKNPTSNLFTLTDSSAPVTPSTVLRTRYLDGLSSGASPCLWSAWGTVSSQQYRELYLSYRVRFDGTTWENETDGIKFGLFAYGQPSGANNQGVLKVRPGGRRGSFNVHFVQQNHVNKTYNSNGVITVGQWSRLEVLLTVNDIGSANGKIRMFFNGVEATITPANGTGSWDTVTFRDASNPNAFYGFKWDPVWGGSTPGLTKTGTEYIDHDEVACWGIPD
jgi:hypothetical protein